MLKNKQTHFLISIWVVITLTSCISEPPPDLEPDPAGTEAILDITATSTIALPTATAEPSSTPTPTEMPTATPIVVLPPEPIEINFTASDGQELTGLYYPAAENPAPVIVLMTWSPGNQNEWEEIAYWLQGRGLLERAMNYNDSWKSSLWYPERTLDVPLGVFTFNFRSCENEDGCLAYLPAEWLLDAQAALETAAHLEGVDPGRILAAGASIGADGAVNSCAWFNSQDQGTCLGAFALSPLSSLTVNFRTSVNSLLANENPAVVNCLFGSRDFGSRITCDNISDIVAVRYENISDHGLELILVDRKPHPLNLLQEFIIEALGGLQ